MAHGWTITPNNKFVDATWGILKIGSEGLGDTIPFSSNNVLPVVFLKSSIKLQGSGTKEDPYKIES